MISKFKVVIKTTGVTIRVYKGIAILEVAEGVAVSYKSGHKILNRLLSIVGGKPQVYISNRVNSYSLDPNDYKHLNQIPTLKGIGVIQYKKSIPTALEFEKMFIKKPFKTFNDLDSAIEWALVMVKS